jgi:hypothetical protein
MTRTPAPSRRGIAGLLFLFCCAAVAAGLGFDIGLGARSAYWIGAEPGAAAALGVAGAAFALVAAHAGQMLFRRPTAQADAKGGGDAGRNP